MQDSDVALIVVTDEQETRQINIVCDGYTRLQFLVRMKAIDPKKIRFQSEEHDDDDEENDIFGNKVPEDEDNANANDDLAGEKAAKSQEQMLPETLVAILQYLAGVELQALIYNVYNGQYIAALRDKRTGTTFPIRACDAVLLTLVNSHIPLIADSTLWSCQSVPYNKDSHGVSLPINTLTVPMLKDALKRAINDERYEAAEQLKRELKRREG